jgi:hypothetical protein
MKIIKIILMLVAVVLTIYYIVTANGSAFIIGKAICALLIYAKLDFDIRMDNLNKKLDAKEKKE